MSKTQELVQALRRQGNLRMVAGDEAEELGGETGRLDGWSNYVTGFGTSRDKTTYNQFGGYSILTDDELAAVYHGHDIAARMVDVVPDEMLREGFIAQTGDAELDQRLADKFDGLGLSALLAAGIRWGRLFGKGGLIIGCDDGRSAATPLQPERAKALTYLYEVDSRYLWPLTWYREPGHPRLGQVETYMVTNPSSYTSTPVSVIHESRLLLFGGATTAVREREINNARDFSILQRAHQVLGDFDMGWRAVAVLLQDANQGVFKLRGVAEAIRSGNAQALFQRYTEIDKARSVLRAMVLDAGEAESAGGDPAESFERHNFTFTGIPDTLDRLMLRLSTAVQIPVTILMGQSPAGMNATGESDFRWFYDRIRSEQERVLAPKVRRLVRIILQTKEFSANPKAITIKFPALWKEPPLAAAQTQQAKATTDKIRIDSGELLPEEVALQRGQPDGYDRDIVLDPNARKVREAVLKSEYAALTPDAKKVDKPNIELAPTDAANVIKVNEARAALNLPPLEGEEGELTLAEFKAKGSGQPPGGGGPPPFGKPQGDPFQKPVQPGPNPEPAIPQ